jgi:hypothetical protein
MTNDQTMTNEDDVRRRPILKRNHQRCMHRVSLEESQYQISTALPSKKIDIRRPQPRGACPLPHLLYYFGYFVAGFRPELHPPPALQKYTKNKQQG